jgi:hypothetical protein
MSVADVNLVGDYENNEGIPSNPREKVRIK